MRLRMNSLGVLLSTRGVVASDSTRKLPVLLSPGHFVSSRFPELRPYLGINSPRILVLQTAIGAAATK